MKQSKW